MQIWRLRGVLAKVRGNKDFFAQKICGQENGKYDLLDYFQAEYFAAWPVVKKLAVLINLNNLQAPDEENYAKFKSLIQPFPPQLVRISRCPRISCFQTSITNFYKVSNFTSFYKFCKFHKFCKFYKIYKFYKLYLWVDLQAFFISKYCFKSFWFQVDRVDCSAQPLDREGNLLQYAVKTSQKEYLQILLDFGWAVFTWENQLKILKTRKMFQILKMKNTGNEFWKWENEIIILKMSKMSFKFCTASIPWLLALDLGPRPMIRYSHRWKTLLQEATWRSGTSWRTTSRWAWRWSWSSCTTWSCRPRIGIGRNLTQISSGSFSHLSQLGRSPRFQREIHRQPGHYFRQDAPLLLFITLIITRGVLTLILMPIFIAHWD